MMRRLFFVLGLALLAGMNDGVAAEAKLTEGVAAEKKISPEEKAILAVLQRNLKATQDEDIEAAVADVDEPLKAATRKTLAAIFAHYDLSYKLVSTKLISLEGNVAQIEVVQETRKLAGGAFRDNRIVVIHVLRKRPDGWKLAGSNIRKIEYLD